MNFFKPRQTQPPISDEVCSWMTDAFQWMIKEFGEKNFFETIPFEIKKDSFLSKKPISQSGAYEYLNLVAGQMQMNCTDLELQFTEEHFSDMDGRPIFPYSIKLYDSEANSAALFAGKNVNGKFIVSIDKSELNQPEKLIAKLSHELAQIKILGEKRIGNNDEYLTDLVTVFFGFGVYSANNTYVFSSSLNSWSFSRKGYFTQQEWGYALALYVFMRKEKSPRWIKNLSSDLKSEYRKASVFINNSGKSLINKS